MSIPFLLIASLTLLSALAAMTLRNLVHCALCAALTLAGLAALFLQLDAQFVGLAQFLVYVGAVAILIVFAILLTRGSEPTRLPLFSPSWLVGAAVAALVWVSLTLAILRTPGQPRVPVSESTAAQAVVVQKIGAELMTRDVLPLEILGLLLTAATIGAVLIAMQEKDGPK